MPMERMNGDYASREAAIKAVCEHCNKLFPEEPCEPSDCAITQMLRSIPAADVRPVVRGMDICDTVNANCEFKCSVCGVEISSVYGGENDFGLDGGYFNFCPNCGAQMEEK